MVIRIFKFKKFSMFFTNERATQNRSLSDNAL